MFFLAVASLCRVHYGVDEGLASRLRAEAGGRLEAVVGKAVAEIIPSKVAAQDLTKGALRCTMEMAYHPNPLWREKIRS